MSADNNRTKSIKRAQKESLLYRCILHCFTELIQEKPHLSGLLINKVELSADKSICSVFFYSPNGVEDFRKKLAEIILYKPSLRSAIAQALSSRYVPEIVFKYDTRFEKQLALEHLLDSLRVEE